MTITIINTSIPILDAQNIHPLDIISIIYHLSGKLSDRWSNRFEHSIRIRAISHIPTADSIRADGSHNIYSISCYQHILVYTQNIYFHNIENTNKLHYIKNMRSRPTSRVTR